MRKPARFTQRDLARAIRGVLQGGAQVASVRIDRDGNIFLNLVQLQAVASSAESNTWDA